MKEIALILYRTDPFFLLLDLDDFVADILLFPEWIKIDSGTE
jgi:hypothetical protein